MIVALATVALELGGPQATAFAARCEALRADQPQLVCERAMKLRAGGHPIEIWRVITPDAIQIFVAIETQAGWYTSDAAFTYEPEHDGEHCSSSSHATRFSAVGDGHAARIELDVDWDSVCPVSDYTHHFGRIYRTAVCVVDDAIVPHCEIDRD